MHALEPKAAAFLIERKQRHPRQQRVRAAAALDIRGTRARRADEIDALDEHARRMFFAKQDHARHDEIHEARAERARPAHLARGIIAPANEVDVPLTVDLSAAEKERIDASLRSAIEQFDASVGEEIMLLRAEDRDTQRLAPFDVILYPHEHRARGGNRRRCPDRDVVQAFEQARHAGDQYFLPRRCSLAHAHAARARSTNQSI